MKKNLAIFLFVGVIVTILAVMAYLTLIPVASVPDLPKEEQSLVPPAGPIEIAGEFTCLPHRDTSGPQTMECAFGLRDDNGLFYGLRDSDPTYQNMMQGTGTKVGVVGTFEPSQDEKYATVGTITVTSMQPLQ